MVKTGLEKILIVEDSQTVANYLQNILQSKGYVSVIASSGKEALEALNNLDINVVLLDLQLSDTGGIEVLESVRKSKNSLELPIIVISSTSDKKLILNTLELGANDFIAKPFDEVTLLVKIRNLINLQQTNQDLINRNNEIKLLNSRLRNEERRYRSLIENMSDSVYLLDREWRHIIVNDAAARFTGVSKEKLLSSSLLELFPEVETTDFFKAFRRVMNSGTSETVENEYEFSDGRKGWYEVRIHPVPEGILCISKDISERKNYEKALQESESLLKKAQRIGKVGHWENDITTGEIRWSDETYNIFGYNHGAEIDPAEIFDNHIHPDYRDNYMKEIKSVFCNKQIKEYDTEIKIKDKTGKVKHCIVRSEFVENDRGERYKAMGTIQDITEQKKTEEEVIEKEKFLQNIMSNVPGGIFQLRFYDHGDYDTLYMSKGVDKIFECTVEDLLNRVFLDKFMHEHDRDIFEKTIKKGFHDYRPWYQEFRLIVKGRIKWIRGMATAYKEGNVTIWSGVLLDITREMQINHALAKSKELYKTLSRSASEMHELVDLDDIYEYITRTLSTKFEDTVVMFLTVNEDEFNTTLVKISGLNNKVLGKIADISGLKMIGKTFNLLPGHYKKYRTGQLVEFKTGLAEFAGTEFPAYASNAIQKLLSINKIYAIGINKDNKIYALVHLFTLKGSEISDSEFVESFVKQAGIIIERKIIEEELIRSEKKFRTLVNNQGEGVGMTDENEVFIFANPAAERIFGVGRGELVNRSLLDFLCEESKDFVAKETELRKKGESSSYEIEIMQQGGERIDLLVTITPQFDDDGKFVASFGVFRDITKRKKTEMALKENEKQLRYLNATKDKLFSVIGHDLRSPLNHIISFAGLLGDRIEQISREKIKHYQGLIHSSAVNMAELLNNLLQWSKTSQDKKSLKRGHINMKKIADECFAYLEVNAKLKNITLTNNISSGVLAYANKEMIQTVCRNLLSNALKYTHKDGEILVNGSLENGLVKISISDNGIGIEQDRLNKIFKLEENTSYKGTIGEKGTGLGLIICKDFIEQNNGEIWLESEFGKGTTFYFSLPS